MCSSKPSDHTSWESQRCSRCIKGPARGRQYIFALFKRMSHATGKDCQQVGRVSVRAPSAGNNPSLPDYRATLSSIYYRVFHYRVFKESLAAQGCSLPNYVQREFEESLSCGRLQQGCLGMRCEDCQHERRVAFSCKRAGFCPSCGARRMAESAALLVEEV